MIQIYWTNNFTERTILLNKRFNWMIVQFENEQNRWKMNYNSENHLIIFLSEQLKKKHEQMNIFSIFCGRKRKCLLSLHYILSERINQSFM